MTNNEEIIRHLEWVRDQGRTLNYANEPESLNAAIKVFQDMKKTKLNTIDKIPIFCAAILLIFTIVMVVIFCIYQSVPDTLIGAFFGAFSIETINTVMLYKQKKRSNTSD